MNNDVCSFSSQHLLSIYRYERTTLKLGYEWLSHSV